MNMVNIPKDVLDLERRIQNVKRYTHKITDTLLNEIFAMKRTYLDNNAVYMVLNHMEEYVKYQDQKLNSYKNTIIALVSAIFIPFGVITGYFGMNFASMGNKGVKGGVLGIAHSDKIIFGAFILIGLFVVITHHIWFDLSA